MVNSTEFSVFCYWNPSNQGHLPHSNQELQSSELNAPQKNASVAFVMFGCLFKGTVYLFMSVLVSVLASASCTIDDTIGVW